MEQMKISARWGLVIFVAVLGVPMMARAHGGDPTKIHSCVNNNSGEVKIVSPNATCNNNWTPVDWNITGALLPRTQPMNFAVHCELSDTIQGALEGDLMPGDTLLVSGTCNENVLVREERERITLDGQGAATIIGPDSTQDTVRVRGRGITIKGFAIAGGNTGINVSRGGTATIDGNLIHNTGQHGIGVGTGSVATIVNNTIENNPVHGIALSFGSANIGFRSQDTVASPNIIQNNGSFGITLLDSSSARIDGNTITGNGNAGINVSESSSARIGFSGIPGSLTAANTIQNNGNGGVRVGGASHAGIEGNVIGPNTGAGISIEGSSSAEVGVRGLSNSIQNNTGGGIAVRRSSSARILAAVISNNAGNGVQISRGSQADLSNNTINANSLTGIRVEENSGVNLLTPANSGSNVQFGLSCRTVSYASGSIGSLTGGIGQKDFAFGVALTENPLVTVNSEGCIDRTTP